MSRSASSHRAHRRRRRVPFLLAGQGVTLLLLGVPPEEDHHDDAPDQERAADLHDGARHLLVGHHADPERPGDMRVVGVDDAGGEGQEGGRDVGDDRLHEQVEHLDRPVHPGELGHGVDDRKPHEHGHGEQQQVGPEVPEVVVQGAVDPKRGVADGDDGVEHHGRHEGAGQDPDGARRPSGPEDPAGQPLGDSEQQQRAGRPG